jgi:hypothetical protein
MTANDIRVEMRGQPFVPKRIFVSDGSQYDVHHPDMCMIGLASIVVGIVTDPGSPYYEQAVRIDNRHVTRILPLPITAPPEQNGPTSPH